MHSSGLTGLFRRSGARQSMVVFAGSVGAQLLAFGAVVLIMRAVEPADFGSFALFMALLGLLVQFSDLGVNAGTVKFASQSLDDDPVKAEAFLRFALETKVVVSLSIGVLGVALSDPIASRVVGKPALAVPLRFACAGVVGGSLLTFAETLFQVRQSFGRYAAARLLDNALRLAAIAGLVLSRRFGLTWAFLVYALSPLATSAFVLPIAPLGFVTAPIRRGQVFRQLFGFSKWIVAATLATMIMMRLDVLMLTRLSTMAVVGVYAAGYRLCLPFLTLANSVVTVLFPKAMRLTVPREFRRYLSETLAYAALLAVGMGCLLFIAAPSILSLFPAYLPAVPVFRILVVGFAIIVIVNPIGLLLYAANRPDIAAYINFLQLGLNFAGNFLLIPRYGAVGAAVSTVAVWTTGGALSGAYVLRRLLREAPVAVASDRREAATAGPASRTP